MFVIPSLDRVLYVFLLETSAEMAGEPIAIINEVVSWFVEHNNCSSEGMNIDMAIIEFNDEAKLVQESAPLTQVIAPNLSAEGMTAMGKGLHMALDTIEEHTRYYELEGIRFNTPWIIMITKGEPTDEGFLAAANRVQNQSNKGQVKCWALGMPGYKRDTLMKVTDHIFELSKVELIVPFNFCGDPDPAILLNSIRNQTINLGDIRSISILDDKDTDDWM